MLGRLTQLILLAILAGSFSKSSLPDDVPTSNGEPRSPTRAKPGWVRRRLKLLFSNANVWIAVATVVTAGAAIGSGIISARTLTAIRGQLSEMHNGSGDTHSLAEAAVDQAAAAKQSAKTAQDTLFANQRAWVGPSGASIDAMSAGKAIVVRVSYSNSGHEPAISLFSQLKVSALDAGAYDDGTGQTEAATNEQECFGNIDPSGGVAFPNGAYQMTNDTAQKGATPVYADSLLDGSGVGLVTGCIAYLTQRVVRHSPFCFYYRKDVVSASGALPFCPWGNGAD